MLGIDGKKLMCGTARPSSRELDPRLLPDSCVGFDRAALWLERNRHRKRGQGFECGNTRPLKLSDLKPGNPGHQRKVIVHSSSPVAASPPTANGAVLYRLRVVGRLNLLRLILDEGFEPRSDQPEERRIVPHLVLLGLIPMRRNDVERFRKLPLRSPKQIGVERELKHRRRARLAGELRILHLVRPRTQHALPLHAAEQVWNAEPASIPQGALDHDLDSRPDRLQAPLDSLIRCEPRKIDHAEAFPGDSLHVGLFVSQPALPKQFERRVDPCRRRKRTPTHREIQPRPVSAPKKPRQVGRS